MNEQDIRNDGSLVPAGRRDLAPVTAANPLVSRGLVDLTEGRLLKVSDAFQYIKSGLAWYEKGEFDKAILDLNEAVRLDPDSAPAYDSRGMAWLAKKACNEAIVDLKAAIRLDPNYAAELPIENRTLHFRLPDPCGIETEAILSGFFMLRGIGWSNKREYDRAIRDFDMAIRLNHMCSLPLFHRGSAWLGKKEYDRAIKDFEQEIRLNPDNAISYDRLAWTLATCPKDIVRDGRRAVQLANKACELTDWESAEALNSLAAAYAEAGQFDAAERYQRKVLEDPAFQGPAGDGLRHRLNLYKQQKVFRQNT